MIPICFTLLNFKYFHITKIFVEFYHTFAVTDIELKVFVVFLVGAFRRKTQTIAVTSFSDQPTDRFYKLYKLTCTTTKLCHTTSTGTWHRDYGFFEVCQTEGPGFESRP